MANIRWCLRYESWQPTEGEWETALSSIQREDMQRISNYPFKNDAKASLVGRLMLRRAVQQKLGIPWTDIHFARTEAGKPYLTNEVGDNISVNVSHHGDYTVLAASQTCQIGVDVVKAEWPKHEKPVEFLFELMRNQFTEHEWRTIYRELDEWDQLCMFYRLWSLKESYVKATGVGLSMDPKRLEFHVTSDLEIGQCTQDTTLYVDGQLQDNWRFEETKLDSFHSVATALFSPDSKKMNTDMEPNATPKFKKISISQLLDSARPLGHAIPIDAYNTFQQHKESLV